VEGVSLLAKDRGLDFDSLIWLAVGQKGLRDFKAAVLSCRQAIKLRPDVAVAHHTLGQCFLAQRMTVPAIESLKKAIELDPNVAPSHHSLGNALLIEGRPQEAIAAFRRAVELAPGDLAGYLSLSDQLMKHSAAEEAAACLERGIENIPNSALLLTRLARAYADSGDSTRAEAAFREALALDPAVSATFGVWLQEEGRPEDSAEAFQQSIRLNPQQGFAYFGLAQAKAEAVGPFRNSMREAAADPRLPSIERMYLAYAEGRLEDREGHYEAAMGHFDRANDLAYQIHNAAKPFDRALHQSARDASMKEFTKRATPVPASDSVRPIFIVGMIRSGTTLLDQMLSAHPEVVSAGELNYWLETGAALLREKKADLDVAAKYLEILDRAGRGARHVTDKMPLNYTHLGLIHRVFPDARIVHIRRNPIDTCLSIYTTYLGPSPYFAYRRDNIVYFYREYLRLMEFWRQALPHDRLIEIDYESLVSEPEPVMQGLLSFCGLPWHPGCLHPEKNRSPIRTPSLWQARNPVNTASIERWKRYEPWLREFADLA